MTKDKTINLLIEVIDNILREENFCKKCVNDNKRVVSRNCDDCVAGMPIRFNFKENKRREV